MKKLILIFLIVVALFLMMQACKNDDNGTPIPSLNIEDQSFNTLESINDTIVIGNVVVQGTGSLTFSITEDNDDLFEISNTGNISLQTNKTLDFETKNSHNLIIEVKDSLQQSASATISIIVQNVDECPPTTGTLTNVSTFVGDGTVGSANGNGSNARFDTPRGVAVDQTGNIYVADADNHIIRKVTPTEEVTTFAGSGIAGSTDAVGIKAQFSRPFGIAIDTQGNLFVTDLDNHRIRKITPNGTVTTFAGSTQGFADGTGTQFDTPSGITIDSDGNVFVADIVNHRIRKITPNGTVTTFAGSTAGFADGIGNVAQFNRPTSVAADCDGNIFVADHLNNRIRKITPSGEVSTLAGSSQGYIDDNGASARFFHPLGVAVDKTGVVFVADFFNHIIRKVSPNGDVETLAGSLQGYIDGNGASARFRGPREIAIDNDGNLLIVDSQNHCIRKIAQ